ncbi:MAG: hypothetical protein QOG33_900 [Gaiellales bacterium]|jgi:hypothetical protein|nr:hypothetical protein [Gaiellales bacterium]
MSDHDPGQHDEIARRLRDEGPAQAPPEIAGEVMRRVRSEPRRSSSAVRRPLTTLLAAAVIIAALLVGAAKLGGSGSGSASGGGSAAETNSGGAVQHAPAVKQPDVSGSLVIPDVPLSALHGAGSITKLDVNDRQAMCLKGALRRPSVTLFVPYSAWTATQQQLQSARELLPYAAPRVRVRLRRLAASAAPGYSITCP